eukprot:m.15522 g.15522  ORF g.15522 m.15522 type:complete len:418 (+) comp5423_c0_seq1:183-1436(+)
MSLPPYAPSGVHHDAHSELSRYFINTCSNAIMLSPPAVGEKGIVRALQLGFRGIELEVHSVTNGKKIDVTVHATGSLKTVSLAKCIKAIFKHGFVASQYPIILCVKSMCDQAGMVEMAKIIETNLQGRLYIADKRPDRFQSPETLKGMVILKCDRKDQSLDAGTASDIPPELLRLIYVGNLNIQTTQQGAGAGFAGCFDDDENTGELRKPAQLQEFTKKHIMHISSAKSRVGSSFNPALCWYSGVQMCGVNLYANDLGTWINMTRFSANGGIGYLKRPGWQFGQGKHPEKLDSKEKKFLKVTVLRAVTPKKGDLFVKMLLTGQSTDVLKTTKTYTGVKDATMKEQPWMFTIGSPQMSIAIFVLKDKAQPDQSADAATTIGWAGVTIEELRDGRFMHPIMKPDGSPTKAFIEVEIKWQ